MADRPSHKGARSCIACRARLAPGELLFVQRHDESFTLCTKRPVGYLGRGAYCCPSLECVLRAHKRLRAIEAPGVILERSLEKLHRQMTTLHKSGAPLHGKRLEKLECTTHILEVVLEAHRNRRRP